MPDVFISYTHLDNARLSDEQQGWVDRFHEALQRQLNVLVGRPVDIWRDKKIEGTDILTPAIHQELTSSSLLVTIFSPGYVNSEWCAKELDMFFQDARSTGTLQIGTKSRIIKVLKLPAVPRGGAVSHLSDTIGFQFYGTDDNGVPVELDPRYGSDSRYEFLNRINSLAYGIAKLLHALDPRGESLTEIVPPKGVSVYLADVAYDVASEREQVRTQLEQLGYTVLPDRVFPYSPEYPDSVRECLQRCRLSIHLLGERYGTIPDGEDRSIVALQYTTAGEVARQRNNFLRLSWIPERLDIETAADVRMKSLLTSARDNDPHVMVCPLETFRTAVEETLRAPQPVSDPRREADATSHAQSVYTIYDTSDASAVRPYLDWLFSQNVEVIEPLTVGTEEQITQDHRDNLATCNGVLICYGTASEFWLRGKLRDLMKSFGYGRQRPFDVKAVLMLDPPTEQKRAFRSNEVLVLHGFGSHDMQNVAPVLQALQRQRDKAI